VTQGSDEAHIRIRAGRLAVLVGIVIFGGKLFAWTLTGSAAVFSDAMESVVNVVAAGLLLFSLIISARPADRDHPYGHGKVEFFSAGAEGAMIAVAAALIVYEATLDLVLGSKLERLDIGLLMVGGLALLNGLTGVHLIRVARRTGSLALEADGRHLLTDVATSVGVVFGLAAVWLTGWTILDPLVAMAVGVNILRTGWSLMREAVRGLMDAADVGLLTRMAEALEHERADWTIDVHSLRSWRSGTEQHVDLHMVVPRYFDAERLHGIDDHVEERLLGTIDGPGDVIVHFDPCRPRHCIRCAVVDCPVREARYAGRKPVSYEDATRGDETLDTGQPR
jgi:cation diffusion facilitator family transporter